MKRLESATHPIALLEVIECICGYHMGIDATFLEQVGDFSTTCPSCGGVIDTSHICPEETEDNLTEETEDNVRTK